MNASTETRQFSPTGITGVLRQYLGGRRGLMLAALVIASAGTYLGWGWLVAAGVAPILIAIAPCAAMCALGVCMNKMGGKSCSSASKDETPRAENSQERQSARPSLDS
jgi:hypothetical protein